MELKEYQAQGIEIPKLTIEIQDIAGYVKVNCPLDLKEEVQELKARFFFEDNKKEVYVTGKLKGYPFERKFNPIFLQLRGDKVYYCPKFKKFHRGKWLTKGTYGGRSVVRLVGVFYDTFEYSDVVGVREAARRLMYSINCAGSSEKYE